MAGKTSRWFGNQPIQARLTRVSGNLRGVNTQDSGPQLGAAPFGGEAPRYSPTKYTTENLAYPMDVEEDPRQGHYIFFNINVQDKAKIAKNAFVSKMRHHERMIEAEYQQHLKKFHEGGSGPAGQGGILLRSPEEIKADYLKTHVIENFDAALAEHAGSTDNPGRKDSSSLQLQNPTTTHLKTAIALYMPPSVQVEYNADYNEAPIGVLADVGSGIIQAFKDSADAKKSAMEAMDKLGVGIKKMALSALEVAAPGAKALAQIQTGRAMTPKLEVMFNGIGLREFSYEFTFIPKSRQEAAVVKQIIYEFKYHMASDFVEGTGNREMEIPSTFDIVYQYMGGRNDNLNLISTCVLQSINVEYGGSRFQAYPDGVPQQTKLSLKFKEMEVITKSRIAEGY